MVRFVSRSYGTNKSVVFHFPWASGRGCRAVAASRPTGPVTAAEGTLPAGACASWSGDRREGRGADSLLLGHQLAIDGPGVLFPASGRDVQLFCSGRPRGDGPSAYPSPITRFGKSVRSNEFINQNSSSGMGRTHMSGPMDQAAVKQHLSAVPLFSRLSPKLLHTLAVTAADKAYSPGDVIIRQSEKAVGFYLIVEGKVEVEKSGKTVATLGPGQFFGEMALLDEEARTANVKAAARTRCLVVYPWEFWSSVGKDPEALRSLLKETVHRLRASAPAPED
jgi:CRP/FNR family transcriptional regulator, cyclic AMP receptor protein